MRFSLINEMQAKEVPVTQQAIKIKALAIAKREGLEGFNASDGWIQKMMRRNNVATQVKHEDASSVSQATSDGWKEKLKVYLKGYNANDIFNLDEMGLFYSLLPSKTHAIKGNKLNTGKGSKIRVTLLVGSNMSGSEKLPLLLIGRAENPRCFKGSSHGHELVQVCLGISYHKNNYQLLQKSLLLQRCRHGSCFR